GTHAQEEGEVERADDTDYPHRHAIESVFFAIHHRREDFAGHAKRVGGGFLDDVLHEPDFEERFQAGAAEFFNDDAGDVGFHFFDVGHRAFENSAALEWIDFRPYFLRRGRGTIGLVKIRESCQLEVGDRRSAVRISIAQDFSAGTVPPHTTNVLFVEFRKWIHDLPRIIPSS